ncbi:MAG: hypothetical protein CEN91_382, partial [Candidatus Berkelbacteria bacterium Licking1014_85]
GARFFAKLQGKEFPYIIGQGKSSDFLKFDDSIDTEGITSYFSVVFEKTNNQKAIKKGKTILLVGDIMLDRGVKSLIKKNSAAYPFQKISQFLKGVDIVFQRHCHFQNSASAGFRTIQLKSGIVICVFDWLGVWIRANCQIFRFFSGNRCVFSRNRSGEFTHKLRNYFARQTIANVFYNFVFHHFRIVNRFKSIFQNLVNRNCFDAVFALFPFSHY